MLIEDSSWDSLRWLFPVKVYFTIGNALIHDNTLSPGIYRLQVVSIIFWLERTLIRLEYYS